MSDPRDPPTIRRAEPADLDALCRLEDISFSTDRISRRAMRQWLLSGQRVFLVAADEQRLCGAILVLHHAGTRLGRMYSLAVDPSCRGRGIAKALIVAAEAAAADRGCIDLRLEVAETNAAAIPLYEQMGYRRFGLYRDYYDDHGDALRMQKRIRRPDERTHLRRMTWLAQQTRFTCGCAALMMALHDQLRDYMPSFSEELGIWREATTIFMTTGHGGSHPIGLALAAQRRGLRAAVWISTDGPLFIDGVRQEAKKQVLIQVDADYRSAAQAQGIAIHHASISQEQIISAFDAGAAILALISTWSLDRRKAPHWVVISGYDEHSLYVHDPDPTEHTQAAIDCQYMPIARSDFDRMSRFGRDRLRTAVICTGPEGYAAQARCRIAPAAISFRTST
ncbi:MAG: peptidase C39 family protein [Planctomycetota bacterium]